MEQNYDKNCWTEKKCPKYNCRKKDCACGCGLKFISVPVSLTEEMAPKNGAFSNAIVRYEATGAVYIYSVEGVPVLVKEGNAS